MSDVKGQQRSMKSEIDSTSEDESQKMLSIDVFVTNDDVFNFFTINGF